MKREQRIILLQRLRWLALALILVGLVWKLVAGPREPKAVPETQPASTAATEAAIPWHRLEQAKDLDRLIHEIGDAQVVLLGEATHGTSEFYTWRATISRRLIEEKGFKFIAVEGDWPESAAVNRYIRGQENQDKQPEQVLQVYDRWPTWMWANHEVASLVGWLRTHNKGQQPGQQVGFYGLDVYSLCKSLQQVMAYLKPRDGAALPAAEKAVSCYRHYSGNPEQYAMSVYRDAGSCRPQFTRMLEAMQAQLPKQRPLPPVDFDAEQNGVVAVNAENYYRVAASSDNASWNIRDRHMMQTLKRLLEQEGPGAKAIVWEHNTHIGDARATDMAEAGMVNLGQLAREQLGQDKVFAVGFGTNSGTVLAARAWERPVQTMNIPPAANGSWEHRLHQLGPQNKLLLSSELRKSGTALRQIGHRAIGVVYDPATEKQYNYVPTQITKRYDAFIYLDKTQALRPLTVPVDSTFPPSLHPWAF